MRAPKTWFSTELHTGRRALRRRLADLFAAPRRRGVLPLACALACVSLLGCLVACDTDTAQAPLSSPDGTEDAGQAGHLPGYEEFPFCNEIGRYDGLTISETERDGQLYYAFLSDEYGASALIEHVGKAQGDTARLILSNGTDSAVHTVGRFLFGGPTFLQLTDVTGDGTPEFLYSTHFGGTGAMAATCAVFDLDTLEQLPLCDFVQPLLERVAVTPLSVETGADGSTLCICRVSLGEGETFLCSVPVEDGAALEDCVYDPAAGSELVSIGPSAQESCLEVRVGVSLRSSLPGQYLCTVNGALSYAPDTRSFELSPPFTLDIAKPLNEDI